MKTIKLREKEVEDIKRGLTLAMQEMDKHENGSDRIIADRLDKIVKRIELLRSS